MRVAPASNVIANYKTREDLAKTLAAGKEVLITSAGHDADIVTTPSHSQELARNIAVGQAAITTIRLDRNAPKEWNVYATTAFGGAAGTIVGASVGVLLNQLRATHPASAAAVDAACAAIGLAAGATAGAAAGAGMIDSFEVQPTVNLEGEFGIKLGAKLRAQP